MISTKEEDPAAAEKDLVATLSAFMRKNRHLSQAAAKEADLTFQEGENPTTYFNSESPILKRQLWTT